MGGSLSAGTPSTRTLSRRYWGMLTAVLAVCVFLVPPARALKGDANGDGQVNALDARLIADYLVGNILSIPQPADADVNGDGRISTADALLILQFSKGLRTSFDFQAPLALTVLPPNGSTGTLLTANISVFFSEPVSASSLIGALTVTDTGSDLPISGRIERAQDGVIAAFIPDQPLAPSRTYRVDVSTAVTDEEANHLQQPFTSTFVTQALGMGILVSTNNVSASVGTSLPQPIVFKALGVGGTPVKQVPVVFRADMGSGAFEPSGQRQLTVLTDANGLAQASFRLGGEAVAHTVSVSAVGFTTVPVFSALATPMGAANLRIYSGNAQSGAPGGIAPFPLIVQATDVGGNPIAGTMVTFNVSQGQGSFAGQPTATVPTNSSGTASTFFTFGATSGTIHVQARFPGMVGQEPIFNLLDLLPQPSSPTVIVGRVIDAGSLEPISHIYVYLVDAPSIWDWTDEHGAFRLAATPGSHVVSVNGFESGPINGKQYPVIAIPINAVEGQENDIGMPALLPELDPLSFLDVSDTQGGTLTLRANPLWQMHLAPGQARFANGSRTGKLYVASVPPDRIPMPVAGGKTSRFFDTVQPLNVVFDPPAKVSFPNLDNLKPGTVTDIFTLSYTSGTFVRTGRGKVSEDGRLITSLPGEGITQGGWHAAPQPDPDDTTCVTVVLDLSPEKDAGFPTLTAHGLSAKGVRRKGNLWSFALCNIPANSGPFDGTVSWSGPPGVGPSPGNSPPYNGPPNNPPPPRPPGPDDPSNPPDPPIISGIELTIDRPDDVMPGDILELTATVSLDDTNAPKSDIVVTFKELPEGIVIFNDMQVVGVADSDGLTDTAGVAKMYALVTSPAAIPLLVRLVASIRAVVNTRYALVGGAAILSAVEERVFKQRQFEMDTIALQRAMQADPQSPLTYRGEDAPATGIAILSFITLRAGRVFYSDQVRQEFLLTMDEPHRQEAEQFLARYQISLAAINRPDVFNEAVLIGKGTAFALQDGDARVVASAVANRRRLISVDEIGIKRRAGQIFAPTTDPTSVFMLLHYQSTPFLEEFIPMRKLGE